MFQFRHIGQDEGGAAPGRLSGSITSRVIEARLPFREHGATAGFYCSGGLACCPCALPSPEASRPAAGPADNPLRGSRGRRERDRLAAFGRRRAGHPRVHPRDGRRGAPSQARPVPGAGLDRIDRSALPSGAWLANAYGHEVGIAEYAMSAILALNRGFIRLDAGLRRGEWESQWSLAAPPPAALARGGRQDAQFSATVGSGRPGPARPGLRHGRQGHAARRDAIAG
jgi:hypothetical protein